jgi:hypothetical protein
MYKVEQASDSRHATWRSYLERLESPTAFLEPAWLDVLGQAYPCEPALFIVQDDDERIHGGALVYHHIQRHRMLYSTPFGVTGDNSGATKALLKALSDHARRHGIAACDLTAGSAPIDAKAARHWTRTSFMLELEADSQAFWSALPSKARNTIRKAQKQTLKIELGPENLSAWYRVYADQCLAKRLTIHNQRYFELLFEQFGGDAVLITASQDGQVIAGMVFLIATPYAHYLFNASRPEALPMGVNSLLMQEFADMARERGVGRIDLGESREGSGVYEFKKKQIGGDEFAMHHLDVFAQPQPVRPSLNERLHYGARYVWPLLPPIAKRHNLRELKALHRLI